MRNKILFIFLLAIILILIVIPVFADDNFKKEVGKTKTAQDVINISQKYRNDPDKFNELELETIEKWLTLLKSYDNPAAEAPKQMLEKIFQEKKKERETMSKRKEALENDKDKTLSQITTPADQLAYLRSIIFNDGKNKNKSYWDAFVSSTTPEERKKWYKNITYNIRNSTSETQTVENILKAQIDIDSAQTEEERKKAQERFNDEWNGGVVAQEEDYRKIVSKLTIGSSDPRNNVTFIDVLNNIDNYVPGDTVTGSDAQKVTEKASLILTTITNVGIVLAILMSAILGIKYMIGSVEEKAEYKKDLLPYFIGSILLFGICTIVKVLQTIGESINNI